METSQKTILVTGGAGFIGSHLVEALVADSNNRVISLDNYFTGKKENHIPGAEYRIGHTKDIETLVPEKPDLVYHLGEYSRTAVAMEEPNVVFDLNIAGTIAVLEFCRKNNCKIVYAGSSTKFADMRDDGIAGRNLSPYTWSKAVNSELVLNYGQWYGLPYAITYFYNVYGPRELSGKYGTVVEIFKQKYLNNEPLQVNLPGTQLRNYTYVKDIVSALLIIGERGEGDEFGIADPKEYATKQVAELFGGEIMLMPQRKTSRPGGEVHMQKTLELGWKPMYHLEEYIEEIKKQKEHGA